MLSSTVREACLSGWTAQRLESKLVQLRPPRSVGDVPVLHPDQMPSVGSGCAEVQHTISINNKWRNGGMPRPWKLLVGRLWIVSCKNRFVGTEAC